VVASLRRDSSVQAVAAEDFDALDARACADESANIAGTPLFIGYVWSTGSKWPQ
jgi:hypothetical protein